MVKLKLFIDRFEDDKAVLITEDNKEFIIEKIYLDKDWQEGDWLILKIIKDENKTKAEKKQVSKLLNKIIKT